MPCFTNKGISKENITLANNGETLSNRQKISKTLNTFLTYVVKKVDISQYEDSTADTSDISSLLLKAIAKYKNHSSVRLGMTLKI